MQIPERHDDSFALSVEALQPGRPVPPPDAQLLDPLTEQTAATADLQLGVLVVLPVNDEDSGGADGDHVDVSVSASRPEASVQEELHVWSAGVDDASSRLLLPFGTLLERRGARRLGGHR